MSVSIIIPTLGRPSLAACLESLAPQTQTANGDRVLVMADGPEAWTKARDLTPPDRIKFRVCGYPGWNTLGQYGHPRRNAALDLIGEYANPPDFCWSIDDDDIALPGALDAIRAATEAHPGRWFIFSMVGGPGSHYPDITVPTQGQVIRPGNVGTPMLVFPATVAARFGSSARDGFPPGYFGDWEMAVALEAELGPPVWRDAVICEVRPQAIAATDAGTHP